MKMGAKKDIRKRPLNVNGRRGNTHSKLIYSLMAGFMVPIVLMVILGVAAYRQAAASVMEKYEESAAA